jgi:hypothetical protein
MDDRELIKRELENEKGMMQRQELFRLLRRLERARQHDHCAREAASKEKSQAS